jgi:hypothetical protein
MPWLANFGFPDAVHGLIPDAGELWEMSHDSTAGLSSERSEGFGVDGSSSLGTEPGTFRRVAIFRRLRGLRSRIYEGTGAVCARCRACVVERA